MYDFETVTDRKALWSSKWDVAEGELPMTTADMDFPACPEIREALVRRAQSGVFGYTEVPEEWYSACIRWWKDRHGLTLKREELIFSTGVVPTLSSCVRKLTTPGEKVLLLTPCYNIFFNSVVNNGRTVLECPLRYDGVRFSIDPKLLEEGLRDPQVSMMILCDPHNPTGQSWDRETLARIGHLCAENGVTVVSDEIHCDLTDPGKEYVPFLSVNEECRRIGIMAMAPTKSFSIPGLQTAAAAVPDPILRHRVWRGLNTDECGEPGAFAVDAAVAAWTKGDAWLDACRRKLAENKQKVRSFVRERIPGIHIPDSDATYLLWMDVSALSPDSAPLADFIRRTTGLVLNSGSVYGKGGRSFLRMNTAYPESQLADGLERLERAAALWEKRNG